MTDYTDLVARLRLGNDGSCPFCGREPYEYADIGVGMERVAVVCCDLGIAYFQYYDEQLAAQVKTHREAADAIEALTARLAEWQAGQTYRYIGRDGKTVLASDMEARAEAAEAKVKALEWFAEISGDEAMATKARVERAISAAITEAGQ